VIAEVIEKDVNLEGFNLEKWVKDWIKSPSLNEIKVDS